MENPKLVKFATQLDASQVEALKELSAETGRKIQTLIMEALDNYLVHRNQVVVRPEVVRAAHESLRKFGSVYKALAGRM